MLHLWNRAKQILHSVMFSLRAVCMFSLSKIKSPAQTNRGNWNCLFGETQITKGCFSYIMKSEAHCLSIVSCFAGGSCSFSLHPSHPANPGTGGLRTEAVTQTNRWVSGRWTAGPSFLGHHLRLKALTLRPSSPPEALVPHLYTRNSTASGDGYEAAVRESAENTLPRPGSLAETPPAASD